MNNNDNAKGRVVQLARSNVQGGTDRISTKYKFTGDIEAQRQKIQPASGASTYNLDRAYTYDALQRPASVSRGNSAAETTTFSYTLQGWPNTTISTSWEY